MSETGVIHDIGYQRYTGPRLTRGAAINALYVHGLRAAFGLGRSAKAKIFPWLVAGVALLVAIIVAAIKSQVPEFNFGYVDIDNQLSWMIVFFVAILAPTLVSRDLRSNTLPLYFSRPLRAADYVIAKFLAMVTAVWLLLGVPQFIMFLGSAFTTKTGMTGVWHEIKELVPGWGYSLIWALLFTGVGLLIGSLTGKQAFAAGGIVAIFLMTIPVVAVLSQLPSSAANKMAGLASPNTLIQGFGNWVFGAQTGIDVGRYGPIYAIEAFCLIAVCLLLLLARYRKVAAL
ncbi:ABC transporter permease [Actinoplanes sp. HUAS TT8]|uniref:ABC transporter permease n=1 Tax=Actinoplanes sp. HUAS TT8 TaxID=3447453 RepID=UPI003F51CC61